ncbi:acetyl-CoA synthetase-like protein [Thelephora ganbajun]|uniref:Acetyl-CoA synthetase-like protein n=1 Tax=Thelephora ganbajun TaxID=370292 RepID=A0ACB6ZGA7_THEGA|nr:acetyl-CoA synthetase-like protein [Thelephora ganbajun]
MIFQSLLPPVPDLPFPNAHHLFFNRPDQAEWEDYVFHVDALTGKARKWYELKDRVKRGATAFGNPDLFPHEGNGIVGILSENCVEYIALIHSLLAAGVPFALFPASPTPFELKHLVKVSKIKKVFTSPRNLENARIVAKEAGFSESDGIFILEGKVKGKRSFDDLVRSVKESAKNYAKPVGKSALAYLTFSSGTTGPPKGVMISHENVMSSTMQGFITGMLNKAVAPPPRSSDIPVTLVSMPFYHSYGLAAFCFRAFGVPCTLVITPKWDAKLAMKLIPKWKITMVPLVPSMILQLVDSPEWEKTDTSSVETAASGAAFLPPELRAKFQSKVKSALFQGYGSSESTLSIAGTLRENCIPGYKPIDKSVGLLMPGLQARIVREDGTDGGIGEPGELWVKGNCVSQGYFNDEEATAKTFTRDGWLKTGDIFTVDEKQNFYFVERMKDTLKISGVQVSPSEIETALAAQPDGLIKDVVVAGVSGGRTSDEKIPRAWIVLSQAGKKKGAAATIKVLEEWCQQNLTKQKWLRGGFEVVTEIPKSPTGKVLRRVLQDAYEQKKTKTAARKSKL